MQTTDVSQQALEASIQAGESEHVEFKRNVNSDMAREMVAFANSSGGRIFIGVDDDGAIPGVAVTNELKARVQSIARDCDPPVTVGLETFGNVLIVNVPEGTNKPYRCSNGFYIRSGASCVKLTTQEILEFMKSEGKLHFDKLITSSAAYPAILDESAANRFFRLARISGVIGTQELLTNLGVLDKAASGLVLNNAGMLFFAKDVARTHPHSMVDCSKAIQGFISWIERLFSLTCLRISMRRFFL